MIPFPYKTFTRFNSTFTWVRFPKGDDSYFLKKVRKPGVSWSLNFMDIDILFFKKHFDRFLKKQKHSCHQGSQ